MSEIYCKPFGSHCFALSSKQLVEVRGRVGHGTLQARLPHEAVHDEVLVPDLHFDRLGRILKNKINLFISL